MTNYSNKKNTKSNNSSELDDKAGSNDSDYSISFNTCEWESSNQDSNVMKGSEAWVTLAPFHDPFVSTFNRPLRNTSFIEKPCAENAQICVKENYPKNSSCVNKSQLFPTIVQTKVEDSALLSLAAPLTDKSFSSTNFYSPESFFDTDFAQTPTSNVNNTESFKPFTSNSLSEAPEEFIVSKNVKPVNVTSVSSCSACSSNPEKGQIGINERGIIYSNDDLSQTCDETKKSKLLSCSDNTSVFQDKELTADTIKFTTPAFPFVKNSFLERPALYKEFSQYKKMKTDLRGLQPIRKRWRLYCFRHVFVLEPNIPNVGIEHFMRLQVSDVEELQDLPYLIKIQEEDAPQPPQLVIYRNSNVIVEFSNATHQLYKQFGKFEHMFMIDSFVGQIHVADARFLVVVSESEAVAGFDLATFRSNLRFFRFDTPEQALQTTQSNQKSQELKKHYSKLKQNYLFSPESSKLDAYIYRIKKAWLIPFHLPLTELQLCSVVGVAGSEKSKAVNQSGSASEKTVVESKNKSVPVPKAEHLILSTKTLDSTQNSKKEFVQDQTQATNSNNFIKFIHESRPTWDTVGFGDWKITSLLGSKLAMYKQIVERLLMSTFYYSYEIDITHTLQRKRRLCYSFLPQTWPCDYSTKLGVDEKNKDLENCSETSLMQFSDKRFTWNYSLCAALMLWCVDLRWTTPIMQGSVLSATIADGATEIDNILITRRSCKRAGTRYIHRGIDDVGNVANFNESEHLLRLFKKSLSLNLPEWKSFVQIRGSVPLFWEQSGAFKQTHQLTRKLEFALLAFRAHQIELESLYGDIYYVNLLNETRGGEQKLSRAMEQLLTDYRQEKLAQSFNSLYFTMNKSKTIGADTSHLKQPNRLNYMHWDFHSQVKALGFEEALKSFSQKINPILSKLGFYSEALRKCNHATQTERVRSVMNSLIFDQRDIISRQGTTTSTDDLTETETKSEEYKQDVQLGVIRTNCLDCLDRTNALQWWLSWIWVAGQAFEYFPSNPKIFSLAHRFTDKALLAFFQDRPELLSGQSNSPTNASVKTSATAASCNLPNSANSENNFDLSYNTAELTNSPYNFFNLSSQQRKLKRILMYLESQQKKTLRVNIYGCDEGPITYIYVMGTTLSSTSLASLLGSSLLDHVDATINSDTFDVNFNELIMYGTHIPNLMKDVIAKLWADQGDHISRAYSGTGSVLSGLIRQGKQSLSTSVEHLMTSVERFYRHSFDDVRQDAIELLLNQHESLSYQYDKSLFSPKVVNKFATETENYLKPLIIKKEISPASKASAVESAASLRVWFGTWNLGGRQIYEPLERWLLPGESTMPVADIYVIAVQEMIELKGMSILLSQKNKEKEWKLEYDIKNALGSSFSMLQSHSLVGLYIAVFVRLQLKELISRVHISEVKLGFKRRMGNKGAVLIRFKLGGTSFCFVNVHLTAGNEKASQRRQQLKAVLNAGFTTRPAFLARDHDCVFLGGDFNFRCDVDQQYSDSIIETCNWKDLLRRDQFIVCKRLLVPPFRELFEAPISFSPTYKFVQGTNEFDRKRVPGWCDRILYTGVYSKSEETKTCIRCVEYQRIEEFLTSDHKPLYGIFQVTILLESPRLTQKSTSVLQPNETTDELKYPLEPLKNSEFKGDLANLIDRLNLVTFDKNYADHKDKFQQVDPQLVKTQPEEFCETYKKRDTSPKNKRTIETELPLLLDE